VQLQYHEISQLQQMKQPPPKTKQNQTLKLLIATAIANKALEKLKNTKNYEADCKKNNNQTNSLEILETKTWKQVLFAK
jgi:hypothetical protein